MKQKLTWGSGALSSGRLERHESLHEGTHDIIVGPILVTAITISVARLSRSLRCLGPGMVRYAIQQIGQPGCACQVVVA